MQPDTELKYRDLPPAFYSEVKPHVYPDPKVFALNVDYAAKLGLNADWLRSAQGAAYLSGGAGGALAMAYAGHQFGQWSGALGDGRARLIADVKANDGLRRELHLKGAGRTPYSRGGDGKATLGSAIREYIVSEAMAALDVPTTRALSVITTGQQIARNAMEPGAVLCRAARSHIRVGTFQYAAALQNADGADQDYVKALADFTVKRLYPDAPKPGPKRYAFLLSSAAARQAELMAQWMSFGFIHGVMNTDNMCLSGETIDYGPCAFMDEFHPAKTFSSIDRRGRYAWNRQPEIAHWNLARLAETLLPLLGADTDQQQHAAEAALSGFSPAFQTAFNIRFARKLGIDPAHADLAAFIPQTLKLMMDGAADFTVFFTALTRLADGVGRGEVLQHFPDQDAAQNWLDSWQAIIGANGGLAADRLAAMRAANPVLIPRNHQIEAAITAANSGDRQPFERLTAALAAPFAAGDQYADLQTPPAPEQRVTKTFCGT